MSDSDTEWLSVGSPSPIPADVSRHNPKRDLDKVGNHKAPVDHCDTGNARIAETNGLNSVIIRNTRKFCSSTSAPDCCLSLAPSKSQVTDTLAASWPVRKNGAFDVNSQTPKPTRPAVTPASSSLVRSSDPKSTRSTGSAPANATDKKRLVVDKPSTEPKTSRDPKLLGSHIGPVAFGQQLSLGSMYLRQCASLLNSSLLQTTDGLGFGLLPLLDHNIKESIIRMMEIKNQLKEVQEFLKTVVDEPISPDRFPPYVGDLSTPAVVSTVFHHYSDIPHPMGSTVAGRSISQNSGFHPYIRP